MSQNIAAEEAATVVTTDGAALHVAESGPADATATLVLVHGWTQDRRTWDAVRAELAEQFPDTAACVRVLRYDLRGHGDSDRASAATATIEQLADDLAEVLRDRAPRGPLILAGHSMGGMTIMALAARHPDLVTTRVVGVVFVATACDDMDRLTLGLPGIAGDTAIRLVGQVATRLARMRRERVPLWPAVARSGARALVFGKRPDNDDVAMVAVQLLRANPANLGQFQRSIAAHDQRAALRTLRAKPAAVLVGDRDRLCPVARAHTIATRLPDAEYIRLPGAGHMLPQERTREVASRIADVLRQGTAMVV